MSEEKNPDVVGCPASIMKNVWEIRGREQDQKLQKEQQRLENSALSGINKDWENRIVAKMTKYQRVERRKPPADTPTDSNNVWRSKHSEVPRVRLQSSSSGSELLSRPGVQSRILSNSTVSYKNKKSQDMHFNKLQFLMILEETQPSAVDWRKSWMFDKSLPSPAGGTTDWGQCWMFATQQPYSEPGKPWLNGPNKMDPRSLYLWDEAEHRSVDLMELNLSLFTKEWKKSWRKSNKNIMKDCDNRKNLSRSENLLLVALQEPRTMGPSDWTQSWRSTKAATQSQSTHANKQSSRDDMACRWEECWRLVNHHGSNESQSPWDDSWRLAVINDHKNLYCLEDAHCNSDKIMLQPSNQKVRNGHPQLWNDLNAQSLWNKSWHMTKNNSKPCQTLEKILKTLPKMSDEEGLELQENLNQQYSIPETDYLYNTHLKNNMIYDLKTILINSKLFLKNNEQGQYLANWRDSSKIFKTGMNMKKQGSTLDHLLPVRDQVDVCHLKKQVMSSTSEWKRSWRLICGPPQENPYLWQQHWPTLRPVQANRTWNQNHFYPPLDLPKNGPNPERSWRDSRISYKPASGRKLPSSINQDKKDDMSSRWKECWRLNQNERNIFSVHKVKDTSDWTNSWRSAVVLIDYNNRNSDNRKQNNSDADESCVLTDKTVVESYKQKYKGRCMLHCNDLKAPSVWAKSLQVTKNSTKPCKEIEEILKASPPKMEKMESKHKTLKLEDSDYRQLKNSIIHNTELTFTKSKWLLMRLEAVTPHSSNWRESWRTLKHSPHTERRVGPNSLRSLRELEGVVSTASGWNESWRHTSQNLHQDPVLWQQGWPTTRPIRIDRAWEQNHFPPVDLPKNGPNPERSWRDSWRFLMSRQRSMPGLHNAQNRQGRSSAPYHYPDNTQALRRGGRTVSDWQSSWMVSGSQFHHDTPSFTQWRDSWRSVPQTENTSEQDSRDNWVDERLKGKMFLQRTSAKLNWSFDDHIFEERYAGKQWITSWSAKSLLSHQPTFYRSSNASCMSKGKLTWQQHAAANELGARWGRSFRIANPPPTLKQPWLECPPNVCYYTVLWQNTENVQSRANRRYLQLLETQHLQKCFYLSEWRQSWRSIKPEGHQGRLTYKEDQMNSMWGKCWRLVNLHDCNKTQLPQGINFHSSEWTNSWRSDIVVIEDRHKSDIALWMNDTLGKSMHHYNYILRKHSIISSNKHKYRDVHLQLCDDVKAHSMWSKSWQMSKTNPKSSQQMGKIHQAYPARMKTPLRSQFLEKNPKGQYLCSEQLKNYTIYVPQITYTKSKWLLMRLEKSLHDSYWCDSWKTAKYKVSLGRKRMRPDPLGTFNELKKRDNQLSSDLVWKSSWKLLCQSLNKNPVLWHHNWPVMRPIRVDRAVDRNQFPPVDLPKNGPNPERSWRDSWRFSGHTRRSVRYVGNTQTSQSRSKMTIFSPWNEKVPRKYGRPVHDLQLLSMFMESESHKDKPFENQWWESWRSICQTEHLDVQESGLKVDWVGDGMEMESLVEKRVTIKQSQSFDEQIFHKIYPKQKWNTSWRAEPLLSHQLSFYTSSGTASINKYHSPLQQQGTTTKPGSEWGWSFRLANPMPHIKQPWLESPPNTCYYTALWSKVEKIPNKTKVDFSKTPSFLRLWKDSYLFFQELQVKNPSSVIIFQKKIKPRKHLYADMTKQTQSQQKFTGGHLLSKTQPRFKIGYTSVQKIKMEDKTKEKFDEDWVESWKFLDSPGQPKVIVSKKSFSEWTQSWKFLLPQYEPMNQHHSRSNKEFLAGTYHTTTNRSQQ